MSDAGGNFADETVEMASESGANPNAELRQRRSTRIVQAVPLVVTGVDALGRPFVERTSSLILNCHGCRYQSKHYVLKNMWVTLEIPHPETGQLPRSVRGRVAWIQRPRTVRQLFQVALELEVSGNVWGIAFPPEDWFAFPEGAQPPPKEDATEELSSLPPPDIEAEALPATETELAASNGGDNLRVFPAPASTTDASLQLARQVARLVADARQQIQTAAREAASQAVSAERKLSFEQWEKKFAAARTEIDSETARSIEKIQQETEKHSQETHAAAAEALRTELPRWLAPQLEQLTRDLTARLSQEALAQRGEQTNQLEATTESLKTICQRAEETAARLKDQAEQAEAQLAARTESTTQALEAAASDQQQATNSQREALEAKAAEVQQRVASSFTTAQESWHEQVSRNLEAAHGQLRERLENMLVEAQERATVGLKENLRGLVVQLQEETARHTAALQASAGVAGTELEQRLVGLRESLQEQSQKLEAVFSRVEEAHHQLEHHSNTFQDAQQQAIASFRTQLDETVTERRCELHREAESLFERNNARIASSFEEAANRAAEQCSRRMEETVQPHITSTDEAIQRLAGGRSLLNAALTLQQDRIRTSSDEAFADCLARFREHLGTIEQSLHDSSQSITYQSLTELEGKVSDLKHQVVDELFKSAEWYEKKAQTQIQNHAEKTIEQTAVHLRDKAGEISAVFATELDHSSRNFVGHTQTQMEDVVRDSFERARALFAEVADTTAAAFTDEVQRTARRELEGYTEELRRSTEQERTDLAYRVSSEQEAFLKRFQTALGGMLQSGVAEAQSTVSAGFTPLLEQWKSMTDAHQEEMRRPYGQMGEQATTHHKERLEGVSNQWLLATVSSLDHKSREMISAIAASAEERLREACNQVFAGVGDSLQLRLNEIAKNFAASGPAEAPPLAKSATTGG